MISGVHIFLNTADAEAARTFCRDILGWACVDAGDGWLIFALLPASSRAIARQRWLPGKSRAAPNCS
jgi:hypothetical protein